MSERLDAALSYAALGRRVFPLQWPVDDKWVPQTGKWLRQASALEPTWGSV